MHTACEEGAYKVYRFCEDGAKSCEQGAKNCEDNAKKSTQKCKNGQNQNPKQSFLPKSGIQNHHFWLKMEFWSFMGGKSNYKFKHPKSHTPIYQYITTIKSNSKITVIFSTHFSIYFSTNDNGKRKKQKGTKKFTA